MRILVLGGGGREHALCYMLSKSKYLKALYCIPGNGGISKVAHIPPEISLTDFDKIAEFCLKERIDLVIPGPEEPLVKGIRDFLTTRGVRVFGPDRWASQLEGSKAFAKEVMKKAGVLTADFVVFNSYEEARAYVQKKDSPLVVKADGLCAGKGVFVCNSKEEALEALKKIFIERVFGEAGDKVVIEERLEGEEASYIVITDGEHFKALPTSQDHKRLYDQDKGPNTGGMGAYSPAPLITPEIKTQIEENIILPILKTLKEEGHPYLGFLYAGLMISEGKPYVLEFNCRLGDPEAQAILPRLENDLLEVLLSALEGNLKSLTLKEKEKASVCVVMASKGYPEKYVKGLEISGLDEAESLEDIIVFHAGTKKEGNKFYTNGGRVLGVTALGDTIPKAKEKAYKAVSLIHFEGAHYRKDIGDKALKYLG
ncbi:MAG: phosphoribosylamine--glycine ligase [Caldimicrobium sp.]|nr:phosphoribosylamine--glycine ligase [Caldimicrobium sp.]MCX7874431.1 phosphoribosylamine--glycine ligase [Caldimicrobium sp.]MDW8093984.1 phosphoribosylamine--glycine ligase [Caldimicrobium sp.]